jgi:hypothetical protein
MATVKPIKPAKPFDRVAYERSRSAAGEGAPAMLASLTICFVVGLAGLTILGLQLREARRLTRTIEALVEGW